MQHWECQAPGTPGQLLPLQCPPNSCSAPDSCGTLPIHAVPPNLYVKALTRQVTAFRNRAFRR